MQCGIIIYFYVKDCFYIDVNIVKTTQFMSTKLQIFMMKETVFVFVVVVVLMEVQPQADGSFVKDPIAQNSVPNYLLKLKCRTILSYGHRAIKKTYTVQFIINMFSISIYCL